MAEPDRWDPKQYERFQAQRTQPFHDLLALVEYLTPDARVADLGCGTGALTRHLHELLAPSETVGVDRSPDMLAGAASHATEGLRFEQADIAAWLAAQPADGLDLVLSNAALHWLPQDDALFAALARVLKPGGQLAVQVPAMHDFHTHTVLAELCAEAPWAERLKGYAGPNATLPPEAYARALYRLSVADQLVVQRVYAHELPSREAVVEWVKGSTLRPVQTRLGTEFEAFLQTYRARLFDRLPDDQPFFFPFKRTFVWARLPV